MRLGLISDTHGFFDPRIPKLFSGVDYILHAGDIGSPYVLHELEGIAPVTAVLGNVDDALPGIRETEYVELEGMRCLIHHVLNPDLPDPKLQPRIHLKRPHLILYGHTHKPYADQQGELLFLNPGYAGRQRFKLPRTIAIGEWNRRQFSFEWIALDGGVVTEVPRNA